MDSRQAVFLFLKKEKRQNGGFDKMQWRNAKMEL